MPELALSVPVGAVQALRSRERHLMVGLTKCSMLDLLMLCLKKSDLHRARDVA